MGPVAQERYLQVDQQRAERYEELSKFDHILKVDVGNKLQLGLIHENLQICMEFLLD
jgi:hypothetical protein